MLDRSLLGATADAIERVQLRDGSIPWHRDGHLDPWNMVEAAMGLDAARRHDAAAAAYRWLAAAQRPDGSWAAAYRDGIVEDATLDANFCAYAAAGVWHHYTATRDVDFLAALLPVVDRAMGFVLRLQMAGGAIAWARDAAYRPWPGALLTSSSCIHLSLGCALAAAAELGLERLEWELARSALADAVAAGPAGFEEKGRFSMDWYYPVLGGVLAGAPARAHLAARWDEFVVDGRGVRCVSDRPWVTTGETCELVLALEAAGEWDRAAALFAWVQHLRCPSGDYWTGATWPEDVVWPRETTTWGAGAVLLAADALDGTSATSAFFHPTRFSTRSEPVRETSANEADSIARL
ncbi:MAG TPA: prenyltransferase [Actinomycetota bacterium]|nr:prenyltransferase [Actinomycetota bacterium]